MVRLPQPGGDSGGWGTILNDFLVVEHNADGTLKRAGQIDQASSDAANAQTAANAAQAKANTSVQKVNGKTPDGSGAVIIAESDITGLAADLPKGIVTAKGDLIVASGAGAVSRLGAGGLSTYLSSDGSGNVTWATPPAGTNVAVQDEGTPLTSAASLLNFTGDGVTATNSSSAVTVSVPASVDWINVKQPPYNAKGDGTTDDTTAILNAITAAQAGTYKQAVFFPAGKYVMSQGIQLQTGLTLLGEGMSEKEFDRRSVISNIVTDVFVFGGTGATDATQRPKDMIIKGLCFTAAQTTNFVTPTATDSSGAYPMHLSIDDCGIHNFITIFSGTAQALLIRNCYLNGTTDTSLTIGGSDHYIIRNFIDGYIAGSQSGKAMVSLLCQQSVFAENYVTCSPAMGIKVGSWSVGLRIINNQINGLAQTASHGGGNYADGPGIYLLSARGVVVEGNAIANVCNNVWSILDSAITVADSSNIVISNNIIDELRGVGAKHIRITQGSGTVDQIKVRGNIYTNSQTTSVSPIMTVSGTTTNISLDEWGAVSKTKAGVPADTDFLTAPPDGTIATNTSTNTLYVRSTGAWNAITGAGGGGVSSVGGLNTTATVTAVTTTEAQLFATTITGNTVLTGTTYRVTMGGTIDAATAGAPSLTVALRLGTTIAGTQIGGIVWALNTSASPAKAFYATFEVVFRGDASASTPVVSSGHGYGGNTVTGAGVVNFTSTTKDMTTDQQLFVTAKFAITDTTAAIHAETLTLTKMR